MWSHGSVGMTGYLKKSEHQKYERMRSTGFHAQMLCKGRRRICTNTHITSLTNSDSDDP